MAVIRDVMPAFELFQPASTADALNLLDRYGADAWIFGGGLDSLDWLKDRIKRPRYVVDLGTAAALIAVGASMVLRERAGEPLVAAADCFIGPGTDITPMTTLQPGKLLT